MLQRDAGDDGRGTDMVRAEVGLDLLNDWSDEGSALDERCPADCEDCARARKE